MSCTPQIQPPFPVLPSGISITPPAPPAPPGPVTLCCKQINIVPVLPPLPFPPLIMSTPGLSTVISTFLKKITDYIDAIPLVCPKE